MKEDEYYTVIITGKHSQYETHFADFTQALVWLQTNLNKTVDNTVVIKKLAAVEIGKLEYIMLTVAWIAVAVGFYVVAKDVIEWGEK